MENVPKSKYHRSEPIRKFNKDQCLYDLVKDVNQNNMLSFYSYYNGNRETFSKLIHDSDKIASSLRKNGVKENETIGVCMLTVPEVSKILLGINKINAVSYWMDASIGEEDFVKYINENNIRVIFLFEPLKDKLKSVIDKTNLEKVILINPLEFIPNPFRKKDEDKRFEYYDDFIKNQSKDLILTKYDRERPTIIVQSSGSTGGAKSIVHTDYNFNSEIEKMAYTDLPFEFGTKSFVCAPPWVIYGLVNSIYSGMIFGHETVFSLMPEENMLYKNLGKYTLAYAVPVYLRYLYNEIEKLRLLNDSKAKKELQKIKKDLEKVKAFISGGDKLTEEEILRWQLEFNTPIINGYGNNEVVGAAIVSPMYANKPGSIGIPMYGNLVKTFNPETGQMQDDSVEGELLISSDALFKEYVGNEKETKENKTLKDSKEWVHSGDMGYIDEDGYVYITGRTKRLIIDKLGYKISPVNSENFIQSLKYVKECIVVGAEVGKNDVVPFAFIELNDEYKNSSEIIEMIKEECSKHMKEYERPKLFVEIDKIPHKENGGKVDFKALEKLSSEYTNQIKLKKTL